MCVRFVRPTHFDGSATSFASNFTVAADDVDVNSEHENYKSWKE